MTPEQKLLGAVLLQALDDIQLHPNTAENSVDFFLCQDYCWGSFLFICDYVDVKPSCIFCRYGERIAYCARHKTKTKVQRRKKLKIGNMLKLFKTLS